MEDTKHFSSHAERYVIGSMIMDIDALVTSADMLSGEMFYEKRNHIIFNAILDSYSENGKVDLVILSQLLREPSRDTLDKVGGASYLVEIIDNIVTTANIKSHCNIIKKLHLLRRVELFGEGVSLEARSSEDPEALLRKVSGQLLELSEEHKERKDPTVSTIISEVKQRWRDIKSGKKFHITSSEVLFGDTILGYYPGHMITVAGYTSAGKSVVLAQMITEAAQEGGSIILFSLEDGRHEKMHKILGNIANVPQRDQIRGTMDETDRSRIDEAMEEVSKWPLLIYDDVRTVEGIRLKIKKAKMNGKVDIVAVDYIQKVSGPGSLYERMSSASMSFHEMAKDLEVTMIILSQIDNESAKNPNSKFLGMKGAGEIAADSDVTVWISRDEGKNSRKRDIRLSIRKNRAFGIVGGRDLQFSLRWTKIEKRDLVYDEIIP